MTVAVYDLARQPITFDIMCFVASVGAVEATPRFVILADRRREKTQKDRHLRDAEWLWRVHRVLYQSCWLLPGTRSVEVVTGRPQAEQWRGKDALRPDTLMRTCVAHHQEGRDVRVLRAPADALKALESAAFPKKKLVILQLRQSRVQAHKNSNVGAWIQAAGHMHKHGWNVVVVPDTDAAVANDRYPSWLTYYPAAALDVGLRCALYETADLVMSTGVGPAYFNTLSDNRYLAFVNHGSIPVAKQAGQFEKIWGVGWGDQLPFAGSGQSLDYRRDDAEAICDAFDRAVA